MDAKQSLVYLLFMEAALAVVFYFPLANPCGSACNYEYGFLNPFGQGGVHYEICIMSCVYRPYPYFYLITDLLVITLVAYIVMHLTAKTTKKRKS